MQVGPSPGESRQITQVLARFKGKVDVFQPPHVRVCSYVMTDCMIRMSSDSRASGGLPTISVDDADKALAKGTHHLLDVRTPAEFREGHIERAINIPFFLPDENGNPRVENHMFLETAFKFFPDKSHPIIATCMSAPRVKLAAVELSKGNFDGVEVLEGGMWAWQASGRRTIQEPPAGHAQTSIKP